MKWAEAGWTEPEKHPAIKLMKCEACGWSVRVAWADPDRGWQFWSGSPGMPDQHQVVDDCPGCGNRLALYKMDLADDGAWHYEPVQ